MKLRIGILFAVVLWCVLLAFPCSAYFIDRNDSGELLHFYVSPGSVTPTIDGVISDDEYMPFPIDYNNDISLAVPDEAMLDDIDFEANTLRLSYDEKYVYIAATTSAADFHNGCDDNPGNMWGQHCLQVSLADVHDDDASMRLEVGYGLSSDTGALLFVNWADGQRIGYEAEPGRDFVVVNNGGRLIYELRIPYGAFQMKKARAGGAIRLCVVWATGTSEDDLTDEYRHVQLAYGCTGDPGKDVTGHAVIHLTEKPGDLNGDGSVDIYDASLLLQHSIFPELYPVSYSKSLDFDRDGSIDIRDAVRLLRYSMYPEDYPIEEPETPEEPDGLAFTSNGDGTCYVSGIGTCTDTEIVIPETSPTGDRVTGIGEYAFQNCSSLTSVSIPESVTDIGTGAFLYCSALTSVDLPSGITTIAPGTFFWCTSLQSVAIPEKVTAINNNAFTYCLSLTSVTIPESVTFIDFGVFEDCSSLESIYYSGTQAQWDAISKGDGWDTFTGSYAVHCAEDAEYSLGLVYTSNGDGTCYVSGIGTCTDTDIVIPETSPNEDRVTSIGNNAFLYCSSLTSITIPDSVTSIGNDAFSGCSSLTSITIPDSVTSIGNYAFYGCSSLTSVNIPDSVTSIGSGAFQRCSFLTSVTIGNSVTSIGNSAFDGCSSLTSITIPDSVTSISNDAFSGCSSLTSITIPDSVTSIGDYAFQWCWNLTSVTIPDSVTSIGNDAFSGCSSLTSITIPDSVTSIGNSAFDGCSSLTSITIPDSVTSIGNSAFDGCSSLTSITIPDSVTSIGDYAFQWCWNLTSVTIPDSVTSIGDHAFQLCWNLTSVTIPDSVTNIGKWAFYNCEALNDIYYTGTRAQWDAISKGDRWDTFTGAYTVHCADDAEYSDVLAYTSNGDGTCYVSGIGTCTDTDLIIPKTNPDGDRVTGIGDYAFEWCWNLTSVTIPDSVTSIGESAFGSCDYLVSVTIPDSVVRINSSAFIGCTSLTAITIPDGVTNIADDTFYKCLSLSSVSIPDSVTSIGDYAFISCFSLPSITIPDSVTSIGDYAFYDCAALTDIYYTGTQAQWDAVSKGDGWDTNTGAYTIHCTDGDLAK